MTKTRVQGRTIITSTLVFVGSSMLLGSCYEPQVHKKPKAEVISNYIHAKGYNPFKYKMDWETSEKRRKELQAEIVAIRRQIREQSQGALLNDWQQAGKLVESCTHNMEQKYLWKQHRMVQERAQELNVPAKYIHGDILMARKGVVIEL